MNRYEYMRISISLFPEHIIQQYHLRNKMRNGFIYLEIRRGIYGLPQAGVISNKYFKEKLPPHGYYEVPHTPVLWRHISRPVQFRFISDNFGVKYFGK